ncbi:MAG: YncE family protein [Chthoniobacterales bacterium]
MKFKTLVAIGAAILLQCARASAAESGYRLLQEIPIGGEGGWDILTVDAHRLYLSHSSKVVVVDLDKNTIAGEITETPGVHAFIAAPAAHRGFSSNGKENKASVVDLATLRTISKIDTGAGPDAMAYDGKRGEVYVFNHKGNSATVIDAKDAKVVATIPLEGSPEFGAVDENAGRIFVNLEDKSEIVAIDAAKHEVVAHWPLAPGEEPTGLAVDPAHHRLFAACNNKLLVMLDSESGKVVGSAAIGEHVDGCAFDPATQLVFVPCGEGVTTIVKEETPEKLNVVQTLKTERGARTIALDPRSHRIYLPTAQFGPAPTPGPNAPHWPPIVPNTLKLLVYGPGE